MAKAKGSFKPEDLKRLYFWIVLPLILILVFVFFFLAKGKIKKTYVEKTTAITAAKGEVDTIAGNKKHPNDNTIKAIKAETAVLADSVYGAWELMYGDQKLRNRWPRQLSNEFLDLVENKLKFRDPIGVGKPYLLEDYGYFIANHLPDLLKEMNRRRVQVREYKLLKKKEMSQLGITGMEEQFWPVYVYQDDEGVQHLYLAIYTDPKNEKSAIKSVYQYDIDLTNPNNALVTNFDDSVLRDKLIAKEPEPYYREVDPWIMDPKSMIMFGMESGDMQGIMQAINGSDSAMGGGMMGGSGGMGGGMMGGSGGMGGGMGGSGGARGSMGSGGMGGSEMGGGMGGGMGMGISSIPGDGYDPAEEQISGSDLEALGGGGMTGGMGGGRMGGATGGGMTGGMGGGMGGGAMAGGGMGGSRSGGMSGGGSMGGGSRGGRSGGMGSGMSGGMGGGSRGGAMAGGGMGSGMSGGMGGGMGSSNSTNIEDASWSVKKYPGLPPYKERRRVVGNVDWIDPEIYSLPTWSAETNPTSIEVWYAQETLWVFEALIRVVADSNKDYVDNIAKAPVKCVEQMLIGQNAAVEFTTLTQTIGDLTGASATAGAMGSDSSMMGSMGSSGSGGSGGSGSMGGMGGMGGEMGLALTGTAEAQAGTKILFGRYIGDDNKPLKSDDKPPFAEFNKMPVCLKVVIDQRRIPDLLVSCANCSMPIDVKHIRICPDNNVPFVMPIPLENMSSGGAGGSMGGMGAMGGSGSMGGGMMGGMSGGMMGGMGGGMGGSGGEGGNARGAMGNDSMGMGGGVEIGRSELSQSEYGVDAIRVEIYGVINIFNEPNKENFATGSSAEEADAETKAILSEAGTTDDVDASGATTEGATAGDNDSATSAPNAAPATSDANAAPATTDPNAAPATPDANAAPATTDPNAAPATPDANAVPAANDAT